MLRMMILLISTWSMLGCSSVFDKHVEYTIEQPDNYPILRAIGYAPIAPQPGESAQQKSLMAMKASKIEAYRELAEQVYGQQMQGQTTVANAIAGDDVLQARVQGVIRGARVKRSYVVGDSYATELELDMKLVHDLYITQSKPRKVKKVTYY
ncbi:MULTISPECIES: LPP20 family lipoprotein [Pseudoalteromonas]|uniref:Flagellar protein FlgP n=1 Tax=Pseudoalteromonas ruthenica TaxID=151081 RepID=A0A0F4PQ60_9GAMM|nr:MULTISPECIES: LPP20 family lipoprotein [Pseudoalteromonas]KJY97274.1 flagellar protein FlgP [Pseudoalteromonas ruthenica]KJY99511.1 flagellar protein FlgP [Pseudoalteromonas ruthenica]MCG7567695.1 LPP20 family lipoprotein [Pseudoalteromonas sp. CnMc7-15]TMO86787.1 flagellar biosynthesis protein FlgP [Pseudoalteromonas ruthenica]TMO93405.1 flagellar biosynthesis protein FlgP [Pseudoalteromonas ruthenica]